MGFLSLKTYGKALFERHFDQNLNAFMINLPNKQMFKIPLINPHKLIDIAWANVLNYGLLIFLKEKNNICSALI